MACRVPTRVRRSRRSAPVRRTPVHQQASPARESAPATARGVAEVGKSAQPTGPGGGWGTARPATHVTCADPCESSPGVGSARRSPRWRRQAGLGGGGRAAITAPVAAPPRRRGSARTVARHFARRARPRRSRAETSAHRFLMRSLNPWRSTDGPNTPATRAGLAQWEPGRGAAAREPWSGEREGERVRPGERRTPLAGSGRC